ncbi:maleylpyruvate isomerase N-terminal domain-containing protein [Sciscionella marina]|uniref:maleylpyruvate isomerase N-terminal domain-containing protein n=1 Tax=Sciscionella marina TaxID=508770 RepID=UPI0003A04978|nr:maleylpyruvate isomerase N-terminal domain-containing protein [Sciscionella marina]
MHTKEISAIPVAEAVAGTARRFTELAVSAPDEDAVVAATPAWSVTDVLGHVAMEPSRYRDLALGRGEWPSRVADLPAFNAEQVRTLPTRDRADLAGILLADTDALLATIAEFGDRPPLMNFDGDQRVRADLALGTLLGEFVVHGYDIARSLGKPWPIEPSHVPIIMAGLHQILPGWAKSPAHTASYALRLRGLASYTYVFRDGELTVDPAEPGRIDVRLSLEPVTALLLNYGRIGPVKPALTGKALVWGRKPWLGPGLVGRFHSP